jgi:hypothetical protein
VTREHSPRPGVTWETRLVTREVLDDAASDNDPQPPRPNRAARRAAARANRKTNR